MSHSTRRSSGDSESMPETERQTRSHLMRLFERHGYHPRKKFGQNFLIDLNIVEFVAREAELTTDDVVLEVGPGTGSLTSYLARGAGHVVSVELDPVMYALAEEAVKGFQNVTLLQADALQSKHTLSPVVLDAVAEELQESPERRLKLVANLPYNAATPIIANLVATDLPWIRMVVTIQYELGLRMQAGPRTDDYGGLSVWLQSQCDVELLRKVPPSVFWPRPKVDSAIVKLTPNESRRARIQNRPFFYDHLRGAFNHRRKYLRSVLAGMYKNQLAKPQVDDALAALQLDERVRAEELDVATHVALANALYAAIENQPPASAPADESHHQRGSHDLDETSSPESSPPRPH